MHNTRQGFTLIELMVSIALMLLLIGIVMSIFNNSSTTVTMAEAKVEIFQNARTTFEAMAQEIADATEICIYNLTTENIDSNSFYRPSLTIKTIAHWIENNRQRSGEAVVQYTITESKKFNEEPLFSLQKIVVPKKRIADPNAPNDLTKYQESTEKIYEAPLISLAPDKRLSLSTIPEIISEYLVHPVSPGDNIPQPNQNFPIYIERLKANSSNTSWSWDGEDYQTRLIPVHSTVSGNGFSNKDSDTTAYANNSLPIAIRITMTFTDEFIRAKRTVSRVFWIPKGK